MSTLHKKILIILVAGIGDLILASKSIRAIRNGYPGAEIHLLTSAEAALLAMNYPYIDHVHAFPIRALRKDMKQLIEIFRLIRMLNKIKFDLALNLYKVGSVSGAMKMGVLYSCLDAKERIGHDAYGFGFFLTGKAPRDTFKNRHFVDAMMDLSLMAGGLSDDQGIEVFWDKQAEDRCSRWIDERKSDQELMIGINPGGDRENRRWRPEYYAEVADRIMDHFPVRLFLLGGPGEENIARNIETRMKHSVINLAGRLSLNDLCYLIKYFDLLITNDSGPMHIGAATKTPLIAIFGPEDPVLMGPYTSPELYRIVHEPVQCRPCDKDDCDRPICLDSIAPGTVIENCLELLK
jgi:heptosyltransferase I